MAHEFDPGYGLDPFRSLVRDYPGAEIYPPEDFRIEWGPIFHRGRLDGSARVLVVGQDPAGHEAFTRRILVGAAGQRVQGFLARLGIDRSYVMINAFLYSVFGQAGGNRHKDNEDIAEYRNRWFDALLVDSNVEAVVAFGRLAQAAWDMWRETPTGSGFDGAFAPCIHPTFPESSSGGNADALAEATARLLENWNEALEPLSMAISEQDFDRTLELYGAEFEDGDHAEIPEADLPAGLPEWMRGRAGWATRTGETTEAKRAQLLVRVPKRARPWEELE